MISTFYTALVRQLKQVLKQALLLICWIGLVGCDSDTSSESATNRELTGSIAVAGKTFDPALTQNIRLLTEEYLQQIEVDLTAVNQMLSVLQSDVSTFIENPSTQSMDAARAAWLAAHNAYEVTALHRYFANRALPEPQALQLFQLQYQINQWPVLPGYIDYVDAYPDSGIVHDITVSLTSQNLRDQHGLFEISEATLGFHVIEYLLWGLNADENSLRPASDYAEATAISSTQEESGITVDQLPTNRRRALLSLVVDTLLLDYRSLQSLWETNSTPLRDQLIAMEGRDLLSILMAAMTDMLTEELLVPSLYPLLNGEYNDSFQSPFSHSTQNAVSAQLIGLERLLLESSTSTGVTLDVLISTLSADFADFFYQNFDASKECLVLLYSTLQVPADASATMRAEFDIVECINLVTNMIDHLKQISATAI